MRYGGRGVFVGRLLGRGIGDVEEELSAVRRDISTGDKLGGVDWVWGQKTRCDDILLSGYA